MRNFEERMDEIRRRSARLLEKKKRRNRLLLACVPVLVCGVLLTGVLATQPGKAPAPPVSMEAAPEFELLSDDVTLYRVEFHSFKEESENLAEINQSGSGVSAEPMEDFGFDDVYASLNEQPASSYSFKALSEGGVVTYYKLEGNQLTNVLTQEARTLTDAQLEALLQVLKERGIEP